ncbi:uncharacterized protein PGTG_14322 [Puccinia graminis f. sp. tritici CRL 75-36-700-3]|uniref:Uncharacterized protein n=1 Tax=Puccinia graminis f. sp. tritici (strain CRL 75-36-700-3 / race SCCL) TaxID=418459 RepID=E3KVE3_PUCGT|nr:uncharacterized protein PGTG_14322 [Puccinia graminis f. sp. tritici CRL 75-36-700-3]EFP88238.2 hypothetical protein PGTG_14322 [Puccinia graminis f. sp. tritici CRL 75-36-700-3]
MAEPSLNRRESLRVAAAGNLRRDYPDPQVSTPRTPEAQPRRGHSPHRSCQLCDAFLATRPLQSQTPSRDATETDDASGLQAPRASTSSWRKYDDTAARQTSCRRSTAGIAPGTHLVSVAPGRRSSFLRSAPLCTACQHFLMSY